MGCSSPPIRGDGSCRCRQQVTALSHELRTTLQAIRLIADELSSSPLTARQAQLTAALSAAVADALATTNAQLGDFALPEAGQGESPGYGGDARQTPSALVKRQVAIAGPAAKAKGLHLSISLCSGNSCGAFEPSLPADIAEALSLICRNLLSNAVAYTAAGQVAVRLELGTDLTLTVTDTGVGFAPSDKERIFEQGVQLSRTSPPQMPGGFGLALAKDAAETVGGTIVAESDGLRGATFRATLPLSHKGLVLLADDAKSIRELLAMQLCEEGYGVVAVADGGAAVTAVKAQDFYAVILDGEMPVLSGSQAAFAIRAYFRGLAAPCPPLIALSGGAHAAGAAAEPWSAVWQKPVGRDEIAQGLAKFRG